jgi:hypothetical protein
MINLSFSDTRAPFHLANRSPLVAIYGLPLAASGRLLAAGEQQWQLDITTGNSFRIASREHEAIYLDGETANARLGWHYGLGGRGEFGLELPVVHHGGGFLDPLIDGYHRLFGFDRSERDLLPDDEFHYQYSRNGQPLLRLDQGGTGIGDLQFTGGYQLFAREQRWLAARFTLKAPTGDPDFLYGSGGWDASAALHWANQHALAKQRLSYEIAAGVVYTGDGEVLPQQRRNLAGFGTALLAWQALPWANAKIQLDGHTAFYQSAMRELDSPSLQLSLGATLRATRKLDIDLALTEDLVIDTAPDLVLLLALRLHF